ncbi:hypothetical protein [Epilithonimonas mollis]|uniref:Uncharacterized protein n=1 Tax=Epilithonimonas mollis TaxID=216903 RepID=A0A1M6RS77_9FLAO|nr:hypothetical protein [Epilithonimonas mollis]SHK35289.1 hypothetical protein SAMN05444371_2050 [Epilithonimonas mollis]
MKKFLPLLLLLVSSVFIFSCKDDDDDNYVQVDVDYPAVYDFRNISFTNNPSLGWVYSQSFTRPMLDQDYVVIFRQSGTDNGNPVWQQIPKTLYLNEGELDYDFDFTKNDFAIYAGGTYNLATTPQYINNQTFRVVLVPAVFGKNANLEDLHKMSYEEIIRKYNIDDSKIGTL